MVLGLGIQIQYGCISLRLLIELLNRYSNSVKKSSNFRRNLASMKERKKLKETQLRNQLASLLYYHGL